MIQLDIFGLPLGYHCSKCGKGFSTMSEISKHIAHNHKKRSKKSVNFVLENYGMTAVSIEVIAR